MKKIYILCLLVCIFSACNEKYTYVETIKEKELIGENYSTKEKEDIIMAPNDSTAFIEAYKKFCISTKVYNMMKEKGASEFTSIPVKFVLYNKDKEIISPNINEETLSNIRSIFLDEKKENFNRNSTTDKENIYIDSVKIKELSPHFIFEKDKFDTQGKAWVKHKNAQKYVNKNDISCYFMILNDKAVNFRFNIQYLAEDWLFIKKYQFSIDGNAYEFIPKNVERDNGDGMIWEWSDDAISSKDFELIKAIAYSKDVQIKIIGRNYYDIKNITQKQVKSIKETYELYKAMGGEID